MTEAWLEAWWASARLQALTVFVASCAGSVLVLALFRRIVLKITARTSTVIDDIVADNLRRPVAASVVGGGTWYALQHASLPELLTFVGGAVVATVLSVYWAVALARTAALVLDVFARNREGLDLVTPRTLPVFDIGARAIIFGGAAYFVLLAWHVDVTGWLASAGIVGVAIGFASQDTVANVVAGVFILADAPYKLGDYLVLETGDRGEVIEIGIRTTRLLTRDDVVIVVPNKTMANARILNQSGGPRQAFRVRIPVGVAYGSDLDVVHALLLEIALSTEGVRPEPVPRVRLRALGESSLDHEVLVWADASDRGLVTHRMLTAIYKTFQARGIEIPYPKRDVYVHPAAGAPAAGGGGEAGRGELGAADAASVPGRSTT